MKESDPLTVLVSQPLFPIMSSVVVCGVGARLPNRAHWYEEASGAEGGPGKGARWTQGFCGIKQDVATLSGIELFDSGGFRIHSRMAAALDPQCRLMLEVSSPCLVRPSLPEQNKAQLSTSLMYHVQYFNLYCLILIINIFQSRLLGGLGGSRGWWIQS